MRFVDRHEYDSEMVFEERDLAPVGLSEMALYMTPDQFERYEFEQEMAQAAEERRQRYIARYKAAVQVADDAIATERGEW